MTHERRSLGFSPLLLRLGLVLALFVTLILPHIGMTAMAATPHMAQHQAADMPGQTGPSGGGHDQMNGAVCAMVCAGAYRIDGHEPAARLDNVAVVRWTIDAEPMWAAHQPDPAQRPPDTAPEV